MIAHIMASLLSAAIIGSGIAMPASAAPSTPAPQAAAKHPYDKFECGNIGNKVFLTFDDAPPSKKKFKQLIDEAARLKIAIGIVPNGSAVNAGTAPVDYARSKGMPVMDHAYNHVLLTKLSYSKVVWQITRSYIGSNFVRPPYGAHNATVRKALKDKGKRNCLWNLDPEDWKGGKSPKAAADYIIRNARKGSTAVVHLQHLGKDASQLARIKKGLAKRGLELCPVLSAPTPKKLPKVLCS